MSDFFDLIKTRRSIREFEDKPVPQDIVEAILTDSCQAPSASNKRPWRFVVIHKTALIKRLSDDSKKNLLARIAQDPNSTLKQYRDFLVLPDFNVFYNAPCLIIIAGQRKHKTLKVDCALCAAYLMFSAASRDLGTCWVDLGSDIRDPQLLDEIGMPDTHQIIAPIIIGYPKKLPSVERKRVPQILKILQ
jgi:nitroreductase